MASSVEQSPFFQQQRDRGAIVLKGNATFKNFEAPTDTLLDPPKFDLDSYIANYDGRGSHKYPLYGQYLTCTRSYQD
jgi:COP9 signalosome complex subunit 1